MIHSYTKHKMSENYVDLKGEPIQQLKVDMSRLYVFKPEGIWKFTKNGMRKLNKPASNILALKEPT